LKYVHKNGCPIDIGSCLREAKGECKKYLESLEKK